MVGDLTGTQAHVYYGYQKPRCNHHDTKPSGHCTNYHRADAHGSRTIQPVSLGHAPTVNSYAPSQLDTPSPHTTTTTPTIPPLLIPSSSKHTGLRFLPTTVTPINLHPLDLTTIIDSNTTTYACTSLSLPTTRTTH